MELARRYHAAFEALRARLVYLRLYVGEFVEKRPAPIEF